MDLNRHYFLHQILLMRASVAGCRDGRDRLLGEAHKLAAQIGDQARGAGAGSAPQWRVAAVPALAHAGAAL